MNNHTCVYTIHIATTPERLWQALTGTEFIQKYWPEWRIESDWQVGSPVRYFSANGAFYSQGEVLEANPPSRLSFTWPEAGSDPGKVLPEQLSWEITSSGPETVKLQLVHERLSEEYIKGVSEGWPVILSSLKSLLERGKPLVYFEKANQG